MTIGVLGTMVWDTIDHPSAPRVERWGGISYSLAAASAALPDGWTLRPIIRLGRDLADRAHAFFGALTGLEYPGGIREVAEPNNRVHLVYESAGHRQEILTGGVGSWSWSELEPALEGLDALYVNLISGFEMDLDTASRLRGAVAGPLYADLHSLLLDVGPDGRRIPRLLPDRDDWMDAFDLVQVNERELALVAGTDAPEAAARAAVGRGRAAVLVTRGAQGVVWYAAEDRSRPWQQPGRPDEGRVREWVAPAAPAEGDPTGCGDVWGAVCFLMLLRNEPLGTAVQAANRAAAENLGYRGADGLREHLAPILPPDRRGRTEA